MNGIAIIDTAKGHDNHGKLTVHTEPEHCRTAQNLDPAGTTRVALSTGLNGVINGQWTQCPDCANIEASFRRFVQEN